MSKEEMKSVWSSVFEASSAVEQAEKALEAAIRQRSDALKMIAENAGKGPFQVKDLGLVTIRCRAKKNDGSEPTYFLVGKGASDITVVE